MNFEINGSLLKRTTKLSNELRMPLPEMLEHVLYIGITHLEKRRGTPLSLAQKKILKGNIRKNLSHLALKFNTTVGEVRKARNEIIESFVKAHWEKMSDGQMAERLKVGVVLTRERRLILGLHHKAGKKGVAPTINKAELEKALTENGFYITEFLKNSGLKISRERGRQIGDEFCISKERKRKWYLNRWARIHRNPKISKINRAWLKKQVKTLGKVGKIGKELGVSYDIMAQIFGLFEVDGHKKHNDAECVCTS